MVSIECAEVVDGSTQIIVFEGAMPGVQIT